MKKRYALFGLVTLIFSLCANAHVRKSTIPCPTIEYMRQSASTIIDAEYMHGSYIASSDAFAIHTPEMKWLAVVYDIQATDDNDAIRQARLAMSSISTQSSPLAEDIRGIYICRYDNGKIETISQE